MAKNKIFSLKLILIFLLTLIGIAIRIIPIESANKGDILVHYDWSKTIYKEGFNNIFFYPNWTYSPPTQPPLMMFAFWTSRHLYENRYILSQIHNTIRVPPASIILWFDKYGEFILLRIWAILGDIICAFMVFYLIKKIKNNFNLALLGFVFMLFNPLSLFESWIWGQHDIIAIAFVYLSFFIINKKSGPIISPLLYLIGLLIKPTVLVLLPFYTFYFFQNTKLNKQNIFKIILSALLCFSLIFFSFKPFLNPQSQPLPEIFKIVTTRITSSSKGVSRASNSGFNFFSLFFQIDKTLGNQPILGITLDKLGIIFFLLINTIAIFIQIKKKDKNNFIKLNFILFFISQATFLFMTGMLERYFFPAFIASVLLMFLNFKKFGFLMIIQNIVWLLNLIYSFYQRDVSWIKLLFESNSFLLIRILSLVSIVNIILIYQKYFSSKKYFATKN